MTVDAASESTPHAAALREAVHAAFPASIAELSRLVRIPSVAFDGFDLAEVRRSAEAVAALASETGLFDSVDVVSVPDASGQDGRPAVLAVRRARNGAPTVLLYAHHDVQPPGDPRLWDSAAYEPTVRDGRIYGRGAADDKAGIVAHLTALRALAEVRGGDPDLGVALFVEGEEESGSRSLEALLAEHHDVLASDAIVVADGSNWSTTVPALTVRMRGNVKFDATVSTLDHGVHSGLFGGPVPDATMAMLIMLGSLWNEDGTVAVEGLTHHDGELPVYDRELFRAEAGMLDGVSLVGDGEVLPLLWNAPAITIVGIDAPSVLNGSNTLAPSVGFRVSARIPPGQRGVDAYTAIVDHLRAHLPFGARLEIRDPDIGDPFLADTEGPVVTDAIATMAEAFETEPVLAGSGASIPVLASFAERFPGVPILVTGVEDPDTRAHSPNESIDIGMLHRTILAEAIFLARLDARADPGGNDAARLH